MNSTSQSDLLRRHAEEVAGMKRTIERQAKVIEAAVAWHRCKGTTEKAFALADAVDEYIVRKPGKIRL